ncbi:P-loop containing nucleoside triphosphate hydrolase protein [Aspergillus sergii]|uniref:P-loop containing nucleoside triphosphate hydrolase protein n=1 Tax=Aspergillus sergii TaxID=1034303 RepID=A0A5N6WN19_9EURO|nr:P-loop containing nucleoside triphosphate hydrolase protein [Aspergillus sergii]
MANLQSVREPRNREMKILILGLARTGTSSLTAALQKLGYSPYDWPDRCMLGHLPRWTEGLQAKYLSRGRPLEADEMDQLTSNFDAIIDTPCCLLVDELITAYPTAKIILNYRDPDRWLKSMQDTVFAVARWPFWRILAYTDPRYAGAIVQHHITLWDEIWGGDEGERCREKFVEHYNYVRKVVPPQRLLEYQVQEGWGPLCRFLEVEEPKEPFPVVHTGTQFMRTAARGWWDCVGRSIRNAAAAAACVWVLGYGFFWGLEVLLRLFVRLD